MCSLTATDPNAFVSSRPVTLIGGGDWQETDLQEARSVAPILAAADGGANRLIDTEYVLDLIVGDLDSLENTQYWQDKHTQIMYVSEQETTDFEKARRFIQAPFLIGIGFLGKRIDHSLAALSAVARRQTPPVILLGETDVIFAIPPLWRAKLGKGCRVSIWPMRAVSGNATGLRWPIEGISFMPEQRNGVSNEAAQDWVELKFTQAGALAIVPRVCFHQVLKGLFIPLSQ